MTRETQRVLVLGATGAQGGSVARRLLHLNRYSIGSVPYAVRALTRRPVSPAAQALARAGVEVVGGSLDDPRSLAAALRGCDLVFGVTNYWEHADAEARHGRALVDAVAASDARHLVLSSLPSAEILSGGTIRVPHFDTKAEVEAYARTRLAAVTFVHVAFYYENFLGWLRPQPQPDGSLAIAFPQGDTPLAAVSVEDVGPVVESILAEPERHAGRTVGIVGDDQAPASYAAIMGRMLARKVRYDHVARAAFAASGFPGAEELAAMFELNRRFIPNRRADLELSRALHPGLRSFTHWMALNHARFRDPDEPIGSAWAA